MYNPNFINLAIEHVLLCLDIPDHLIPMAIADQAKLLGQIDCEAAFDDDWVLSPESFVSFH